MTLETCASPLVSLDFSAVDAIVCEEAGGYSEIFLERFADDLQARSEGLVDCLQFESAQGLPFGVAWSAEFSWLTRSVTDPSIDPVTSAVRTAVKLSEAGRWSDWSCRLGAPAIFRAGHCFLPDVMSVASQSDGDTVTLSFGHLDGDVTRIEMSASQSQWNPPACGIALSPIDFQGDRIACLTRESFAAVDFRLNDMPWTIGGETETRKSCAAGLKLLQEAAPKFAPWVGHVVRNVVPLTADRYIRSQSASDYPGTIALSSPASRTAIAEMFVHESSHQYYHILERFEPVQDPASNESYYSPVKKTQRPLCMILLAYHAFANVILFYRACLDAGIAESEQCELNIARHLPELRAMEQSLASSHSLTDAGRLLFDPLAELIADF